jgi:hypothetical protein
MANDSELMVAVLEEIWWVVVVVVAVGLLNDLRRD